LQTNQLLRERSCPSKVIAVPTKVHPHVAANGPTQVSKGLRKRSEGTLAFSIVFVNRHEHTDAPDAVGLLRPCREWPRRRASEPRDERPAFH
jgi:hypothetical protein